MTIRTPAGSKVGPKQPDHGGTSYQAGWRNGYEAGTRMGRQQAGGVFEGTSIVVPVGEGTGNIIPMIRHLEAVTPYPYELLLADFGADEQVKSYARRRAGVIRLIESGKSGGRAAAINQAMRAAGGRLLSLLSCGTKPAEEWLAVMGRELRNDSEADAVFCRFSAGFMKDGARSREPEPLCTAASGRGVSTPIHCILYRRDVWLAAGELDEGGVQAEDGLGKWLERLRMLGLTVKDVSGKFA